MAKPRQDATGHARYTPNPAPSFLSPEMNAARAGPGHQSRKAAPQQGTPPIHNGPALPAAENKPNTSQLPCISQPCKERGKYSRASKRHRGTRPEAEGEGMIHEARAPTTGTCKVSEKTESPLSPLNGVRQKEEQACLKSPRHCLSSAKATLMQSLRTGHSNQENVAPQL